MRKTTWAGLAVTFLMTVAALPSVAQSGRLPGSSQADALLQHDAMFYVGQNVGVRQKGCPRFEVVDTEFVRYEAAAATARRPWHETWTVKACGHTWKIPITFTPDATGTNITVPIAGPAAQ